MASYQVIAQHKPDHNYGNYEESSYF